MENKQLESVPKKSKIRSDKLIANFIGGYADGWYMALKESFKMELDIKFTERSEGKILISKLPQGPYYCFSEGQIIYDAKEGYGCWQDALKKINLACQIIEATPNTPLKKDHEITEESGVLVYPGSVKFVLFKPDDSRTKLVPFVGYNLSQNDFVNFLKTGQL